MAVCAEAEYRSQKNKKGIASTGLASKIHFRRPLWKPMPTHYERANASRANVRSAVEHPFPSAKAHMGLFVRTAGIDCARAKIGMAAIAYNMDRKTFRERRSAVAKVRAQGPGSGKAIKATGRPDDASNRLPGNLYYSRDGVLKGVHLA